MIWDKEGIDNLQAFEEFFAKFMVESYSKYYMEDGSALDMPQLVLWNGLDL